MYNYVGDFGSEPKQRSPGLPTEHSMQNKRLLFTQLCPFLNSQQRHFLNSGELYPLSP